MSERPTGPESVAARGPINLRRWFILFVLWMVVLTLAARYSLAGFDAGNSLAGRLWLLSVYAFYLSLCCSFCPLPTAWIVLLLASNQVNLVADPGLRILVVASVGTAGTVMANLNEYHLFTYLLEHGKVGAVRRTRLYRVAAEWFGVGPFLVLLIISFIPIPVDIVRWLAITYRYPRTRYAAAYGLGRWLRYALYAALSVYLDLQKWHIILIQGVIIAVVAVRLLQALLRHRRERRAGTLAVDAVSNQADDVTLSQETA